MTGACAAAIAGWIGGGLGGGFLICSKDSFLCSSTDFFDSSDSFLGTGGGWDAPFFALSPSPQFKALAMPHSPLRLGGRGGFSPIRGAATVGGGRAGTSSSHIFSTIPVRTKAHSVQVARKRARHHLLVQSG